MKKLVGYFDFQCPYCYLGTHYARLMQQEIPCVIEWRPINIHPEIPAEGMDIAVAYPDFNLVERIHNLRILGGKVELPVVDFRWLSSTQKALEAFEYSKKFQKENFMMYTLFNAYWGAGVDIGEEAKLLSLVEAIGIDTVELPQIWAEGQYKQKFDEYYKEAEASKLDVVPTLYKDGVKVLEATKTMEFAEYQSKFREIWK